MMSTAEARRTAKAMVRMGIATDLNDAYHQLVDAGEIDVYQHGQLLTKKESRRIYGD